MPSHKYLALLWAEMKVWQSIINREAENFSGDNLITNQDTLKSLSALVENWSSVALEIFGRHQQEQEGGSRPESRSGSGMDMGARLSTASVKGEELGLGLGVGREGEGEVRKSGEERVAQQLKSMVKLRRVIESKLAGYGCRVLGENGVFYSNSQCIL